MKRHIKSFLDRLTDIPPAALAGGALVLGILLLSIMPTIDSLTGLIVILTVCLLTTVMLLAMGFRSFWVLLLLPIVGLGALRFYVEENKWKQMETYKGLEGKHEITVLINEEPVNESDKTRFNASILMLDGERCSISARLTILRKAKAADLGGTGSLQYGDYITCNATLSFPSGPHNPFGVDYRQYLHARGIGLLAMTNTSDSIVIVKRGQGQPLLACAYDLRRSMSDYLNREVGGQESALIKGVLLGIGDGLSDETEKSFKDAGVTHVLVVSGQNVSLLAFILYSFMGFLGMHKRWAALATIPLIVFYGIMTGLNPPVVRAVIMATIVLTGMAMGRKPPLGSAIGAAAFFYLLYNPLLLFDASFLLSFAATLGIALFTVKISNWLHALPDSIRTLVSAGIAAQIGVTPFLAYFFYRYSLYSLIANLIVIPLADALLIISSLALLLSLLVQPAAWAALSIARATAALMNESAVLFSRLPCAVVTVGKPSLVFIFFYYVFFASLFLCRTGVRIKLMVVSVVGALFMVALPRLERLMLSRVEGVVFDVGQADCALVQTPVGNTIIVDTGTKWEGGDSAQSALLPYLHARGITCVEMVILTHPHKDHIGGVESLLENCQVNKVIIPRWMESENDDWKMVRQSCLANGVELQEMSGPCEQWLDNVRITLWQPLPTAYDKNREQQQNERGLATYVEYGEFEMVLPADLGAGGMEALADNTVIKELDIIKAPHHGSALGDEIWVERWHPVFTVISALGGKAKLPSTHLLGLLAEKGLSYTITGMDGALEWWSDGKISNARSVYGGREWIWDCE